MKVDFIDWLEVKGEVWYKAEDIITTLGYIKDKTSKNWEDKEINALVNKNLIPYNIHPKKKIEGFTWWNKTSLTRFKHELSKMNNSKSKTYLNKWQDMERLIEDSIKDTLIGEVTSFKCVSDTKDIKKVIDYKSLAKNTRTFLAFSKKVRSEGGILKYTSSWKALEEHYPLIWDEVKDVISERLVIYRNEPSNNIKNNNNRKVKKVTGEGEKSDLSINSPINKYSLTFQKVKHLLNFKVKTCKVILQVDDKNLTEKLIEMLGQGYQCTGVVKSDLTTKTHTPF